MTNKYDIITLDKVDSTNTEARKRIADIDNLSVLSAKNQTQGRGQRGNKWISAPGLNLTFSIVIKFGDFTTPPLQAYDQFAISQMASLAVVDFLAAYDIEAKIKWPNDIYVGNRKICGMLIENSLKGDLISWSIVGIGINVNQLDFDAPNATSMSNEKGRTFDTDVLLHDFLRFFEEYRSRYLHINGGLGKLRNLYLSQMWKLDEEATLIDYRGCGRADAPINVTTSEDEAEGRVFCGTIRGISDTGMLVVEENDIAIEFGFKEIGWIIKK